MNLQQQVQQIVTGMMQSNKFTTASVPRHIHNDIDAPYVFQPFLTYAGFINTNGTAALLPTGWTVIGGGVDGSGGSTGVYTITHNLNTFLYACVATPLEALETASIPQILQGLNEVVFTMFAPLGGANNTDFSFILTNVNNTSTKLPTYYGTLVSSGTHN